MHIPFKTALITGSQWNLMATADLNRDGRLDVIIGSMDLENIAKFQQRFTGRTLETGKDPILFFENRMH